ncbi:MAG TPA: glycosyltransferase family 4 protein [Gemmatimonadota bacterium]|nr:glycosyltransferase family 4 protein [Gemmatimonadota bacterium]
MRLLLVSSEFPPGPGGIGRHAHDLARALESRGWEIEAHVWQDYASDPEIEAFDAGRPFPVFRLPERPLSTWTGLESLRRISRAIGRRRPDALLATGRRAVWLAARAAARADLPWMAIGHGTEFSLGSVAARAVSRRAYGSADIVVCVSRYTRRVMEESGIRPPAVATIPNGADPELFRPVPAAEAEGVRRRLGLEGTRVLLTVGRVGPRKGQDIVIRALPAIARAAPEVVYVLTGIPDGRPELERLAGDLGVADRVRFLGTVADETLVALENAAQLFVMTSRRTAEGDFEGYGIAVVEAALCGLPAVVAGESGLAEAVEDGVTGLVVPPEDPAATAAAVIGLLRDEGARRAMGERARERATREQTWAHRAEAYDAELRRIVRGGASSQRPRSRS